MLFDAWLILLVVLMVELAYREGKIVGRESRSRDAHTSAGESFLQRRVFPADIGYYGAIIVCVLIVAVAAPFAALAVRLLFMPDRSDEALDWMTVSAGLGAFFFGSAQLAIRAHNIIGRRRRLRAVVRLAHRACVEMVNSTVNERPDVWISNIGSSDSLDPTEAILRELQQIGSELGGRESKKSESALSSFLNAADHINPLRKRLAGLESPVRAASRTMDPKAKILEALFETIEALEWLRQPDPEEPRVHADARDYVRVVGNLPG